MLELIDLDTLFLLIGGFIALFIYICEREKERE